MKKLLNNKKGFTLIELLAVIVILAILVMVAIPAVTKYLNAARQGTFADNAKSAISAVRNDVIIKGNQNDTYTLEKINGLLEKKLNTSPWGAKYAATSCVKVVTTNDKTEYSMCLIDEEGHGWKTALDENLIKDNSASINGLKDDEGNTIKTCTCS